MKFHGTSAGLKVTEGGQEDWLIVAKFMQGDNQIKFGDYMRQVATELTKMEPFSEEMAAHLEATSAKVSNAKTAESFLEEVTF
jgi:hypothetical protein